MLILSHKHAPDTYVKNVLDLDAIALSGTLYNSGKGMLDTSSTKCESLVLKGLFILIILRETVQGRIS